MAYKQEEPTKLEKWLAKWLDKTGWLIVLGVSLGLSAYSLFFITRSFGVPIPVAAIVSLAFDGVALKSADYSLKYARVGLSGFGPRMAVILFAAASAFINSQHAAIGHEVGIARLLWAIPPIGAVVILEFHIRWSKRQALESKGRIAPAMPPLGKWAWLLFPIRTPRIARRIVAYRLGVTVNRYAPGVNHAGLLPEYRQESSSIAGNVTDNFPDTRRYPPMSEATTRDVREWAEATGMKVSDRGSLPQAVCDAYVTANGARPIEIESHAVEFTPYQLNGHNGHKEIGSSNAS